ncbi:MAG: hypothetical protein HPY44_00005 [Armatimonadetes bacterium]|nr:hypothetical protein [Armatimonadota bacterium]
MGRYLISPVLLLIAATAYAALPVGSTPPLLSVRVLAGQDAGKTIALAELQGSSPYVVVFLNKADAQAEAFIKQFDALVAAHPDWRLRGCVVLVGEAASETEWGKGLYASAKLAKTSLAALPDGDQVRKWEPVDSFQANCWFVYQGRLRKRWALNAPQTGNLVGKLNVAVGFALDPRYQPKDSGDDCPCRNTQNPGG